MTYLRMPRGDFHPDEGDLTEYEQVRISRREFLNPSRPEHYGQRVVWSDGTLRQWPEDDAQELTVLRRKSGISREGNSHNGKTGDPS